jgi:UDP-N-acetylmuramoylalanine--D-glutamate ligase
MRPSFVPGSRARVSDPLVDLASRSIVIAGFGVEGRDVFRFLRGRFPDQVLAIAEARTVEALDPPGHALIANDRHLVLHSGPDHLKHVADYDVAFRSPGIPLAHPALSAARAHGTVITSQAALFFALCRRRVVGVTGTKGKSTTTALIHAMLEAGGHPSHLVGNIGPELGGASPLGVLETAREDATFVYELSSFQLEDLTLSPDIAVLLDIVPEHLDHHGSFEAYAAAKENITRYQTATDWLVVDAASPTASAIATRSLAHRLSCRHDVPLAHGCFVAGGQVVFRTTDGPETIVPAAEVERALPGRFNLRNVLPAVAVGRILSVDPEAIAAAIRAFRPLRDRFEDVGTFRDITFYNAAIATVPEATIAHLAALSPRVATVILGGVDRGVSYETLARTLVAEGVRTLILFPTTGARIWAEIERLSPPEVPRRVDVEDMETAVRAAYELTPRGMICLHSPAAPSRGGLFSSYAERGAQYREWVARLGR